MSVRLELVDLIAKVNNTIEVFNVDNENSEFEDDPEVIERLEQSLLIFETAFPYMQLVEDLLYGEITPVVFMKRWKKYAAMRGIDIEVDEISPEVQEFLKRVGDNPPEGESV